jgi:hypothetical protein
VSGKTGADQAARGLEAELNFTHLEVQKGDLDGVDVDGIGAGSDELLDSDVDSGEQPLVKVWVFLGQSFQNGNSGRRDDPLTESFESLVDGASPKMYP